MVSVTMWIADMGVPSSSGFNPGETAEDGGDVSVPPKRKEQPLIVATGALPCEPRGSLRLHHGAALRIQIFERRMLRQFVEKPVAQILAITCFDLGPDDIESEPLRP